MSSRWYPLYKRGNPQLRVFLPNFWMKLVKPSQKLPANTVLFQTSPEMTHYDVKNYLEKIYGIQTAEVKVEIKQGKTKRAPGRYYIIKEDDYKVATVTLPRSQEFQYPELFKDDANEDDKKDIREAEKKHLEFTRRNLNRPGIPAWFS